MFSKSMSEKKVLAITSFSQKGLDEYAKDFLATYNLPCDLLVYSEDKINLDSYEVKKLKAVEYLFDDVEFKTFIENEGPEEFTSRSKFYQECNENCNKVCFEHFNKGSCNGFVCKTVGCNNAGVSARTMKCIKCIGRKTHIKEAKTFSFKVFSQMNAILKYKDEYDYMIYFRGTCNCT